MPQDFDWNTLAASIIPAAVGLLAGGRNRGLAGAYGAAEGMANYGEQSLALDKTNREIEFKNRQQGMEQQRIDLEGRRTTSEEQRAAMLDRQAEEQMKLNVLHGRELQMKLDEAGRTQEGRRVFRETLKPDEQQLFDLDPEAYRQQALESRQLEGAGKILSGLGIKDGDTMAKVLGSRGTSAVIASVIESRNRPQEPYWFSYDANSGMLFKGNKQTGEAGTQTLGTPKASMEDRIKVRKLMLDEFMRTHPGAKELADAGGDNGFDDWAASPEGTLQEQWLLKEIKPEEYRGARDSLSRQDQALTAEAMQQLHAAYLSAGTRQTEAGFQKYMTDPKTAFEAKKMLDRYKDAIRLQGRGRQQSSAVSPARPFSTEEKALAKTPAWVAEKKGAAAKDESKKRRSLDEIAKDAFGG
jgi:hypothetical protein